MKKLFNCTVTENARVNTRVQVSAKDAEEAEKIARTMPGKCIELSSSIDEMTGNRQVWSVREVETNKKVFMTRECGCGADQEVLIHDGETETCMRSQYPMHIVIVRRLLSEAGYVEVRAEDWPKS